MSQTRPPISRDSTHRVLGAWNLGLGSEPDDLLNDSLFAPKAAIDMQAPAPAPLSPPNLPDPRQPFPTRPRAEPEPYHAFSFGADEPADDLDLNLDAPAELRRSFAPRLERKPVVPEQTPNLASVDRPPPKLGEFIGGFRIVSELGRGAFARVYLAEQVELGNRLVALKVSRAEGDEPQMLARLQHTHIVPIHSVYDDPETGQRLLCMPYLGGANLAQVLEATGGQLAGGNAGRSLVAALDEVSQRFRHSGRPSVLANASRDASGPRSIKADGLVSGPRRDSTEAVESDQNSLRSLGRGSLDRLNQLWGRVTGRGGCFDAPKNSSLDGSEFDQPARQFLRGANTVQAAVWIVARLAEGLEHAHSRDLLHRDLKPSNILIAGDGTPMLLDFNLSSSTEFADPAEGEKAMLGGTLPYMSPEHLDAFNPDGATHPRAVDERSDIYALGLILFEMLAGSHPFPEPTARVPLLEAIRTLIQQRKIVPSLRAANKRVSWGLDSIVRKCLDPNPAKRYARARDFAEDLNRFLDDLPLRFASEASVRERIQKWSRRNPRLCGTTAIAGFAAILVITLGGLIGLLHGNMQNLATRLKLQVFREDLANSRFLLNLSSGPVQHIKRGIEQAQKTLESEHVSREGGWQPDSWAYRLTGREQIAIREQTAELILLLARGRVYFAGRVGTEEDQRKELLWAIDWLNRAEKLDPNPPSALYADRARYHAALGQADLAAADRAKEANTPPSTARDYTLLGSAKVARGELDRAEPLLLKAVDLDPRSFWAWFALGHCHAEQGRNLDAAGEFAACVVLEPKFAWPYVNRGLALARAGRLSEARSAYDHALKANPRFAEAWLNRALVDLELNDLASAERALGQAISLGRREPGVYAAWAEVKARRGNRAEAEELFDRLLKERPDDPVFLTARGIFRLAADHAGASTDLRRAVELDPGNARAHYGLALLLRVDDPEKSLVEADIAFRADPGLFDALQLRALLRARAGDPAAAGDAERISQVQTPHRLYNAACTLALLVKTAGEQRLATRAIDLLDRALDSGFPADHASKDPDLAALRDHAAFRETIARHKEVRLMSGNR